GFARHGRYDHSDLFTFSRLGGDNARRTANSLQIGHRSSTELHDQTAAIRLLACACHPYPRLPVPKSGASCHLRRNERQSIPSLMSASNDSSLERNPQSAQDFSDIPHDGTMERAQGPSIDPADVARFSAQAAE